MSITAKVQDGRGTLPPDLDVPNETEVEIILPKALRGIFGKGYGMRSS
jgi:hypothetical protein